MRIVFLGTPSFAVPSLEGLARGKYDIAAAVTQPDKKSGRGRRVCQPPVKLLAARLGIPVLQFDSIKREGESALKRVNPDIIITAAYGQILPKQILYMPKFGCVNVHASLLPKYRGAAPVQWAIINGETRTGVTIMQMNEGLDTGDIISARETDIDSKTTGGELYEKLSLIGARLLLETLKKIEEGAAERTPQKDDESSYYPPLSRALSVIDWRKSAKETANLIRALDPCMGAVAHTGAGLIKIWSAQAVEGSAKPASIVCADAKSGLIVGTGDGLLRVTEIQAPCCKRMAVQDFLRGRCLPCDKFVICDKDFS
ncbi:MAG: methionyl-tRNA formyltransferase [Christensenellales bacterium]